VTSPVIPDEAVEAAAFTAAGSVLPPDCRNEYMRAALTAAAPAILVATRLGLLGGTP